VLGVTENTRESVVTVLLRCKDRLEVITEIPNTIDRSNSESRNGWWTTV